MSKPEAYSGETITLGTLMVEEYERPVWSFNKLLYIEKEGAQEALKQDGWLERHDCAVMSSKTWTRSPSLRARSVRDRDGLSQTRLGIYPYFRQPRTNRATM